MDTATYITESRFCESPYEDLKLPAVRLIHAALGLGSELIELQDANRKQDMREASLELGDICWYAATILDEAKYDWEKSPVRLTSATTVDLARAIEECMSAVKALVYYKRPLEINAIAGTAARIFTIAATIGREQLNVDVLDLNLRKLKTRYGAKFSQQSANVRNTEAENLAAKAEQFKQQLLA